MIESFIMASHRILIVDDQRETARVMHSSLEGLQQDFEITDILSGEEAVLELARGKVDLLVSDVRLPGISGLELMTRFKKRNKDTKVILVSGVADPKIRQQVAQAGADAFFFKPIEIADFLDAVERILGLVDTILPHEMEIEREEIDAETEAKGMTERIADLRTELDASAVFLLGDQGQVMVRAGTLPDQEIEKALLPHILPAISTAIRITHFLKSEIPQNLFSFQGPEYNLYFSLVGEAYSFLITTSPNSAGQTGMVAKATQAAAKDILAYMVKLGISSQAREPKPAKPAEPEEVLSDPALEVLFAKDVKKSKAEEAEAFWDSMDVEDTAPSLLTGDSLTYEQAVQLGLAPPDKE